jgi:hypothetical protein
LQNKDKDLVVVEAQLLKQQQENKHLVVKVVEVERVIEKAETLQSNYYELTQPHSKTRNDLKTLQTDLD